MIMRDKIINSIINTIYDYREGEIAHPTSRHINLWVNQFNKEVQLPILKELDYVLRRTYFSKAKVGQLLSEIIVSKEIGGDVPYNFWKRAYFLNIQGGGSSQTEMNVMFNAILQKECGISMNDNNNPKCFIYLDDAIFSGSRVRNDLIPWIKNEAPNNTKLHIIVIALHKGYWYARDQILDTINKAEKKIDVTWWKFIEIEDRKAYIHIADVLKPACLPDDKFTQQYIKKMSYPPTLRNPGSVGNNGFFSSEEGRHLLEQEF